MTRDSSLIAVVWALAPLLASGSGVATFAWFARNRHAASRQRLAVALTSAAAAPGLMMTAQYGWLLLSGYPFDPYGQSSLLLAVLWIAVGPIFLFAGGCMIASDQTDARTMGLSFVHALAWLVTSYCALQVAASI